MHKNKRIFVGWTRIGLGYRTREISESLEAEPVIIHRPTFQGIRLPTALRYLVQSIETFALFVRHRPNVVIVQTPPWVLTLVAWAYTRLFRGCFITDNHSVLFMDPRWQRFHPLDRFFSRRALANLAHNYKNLEILERWGARNPMVLLSPALRADELYDPQAGLAPELEAHLQTDGPRVFVVCRFGSDDCHEEVFETARQVPTARFFVTGDWQSVGLNPHSLPPNVVLTSFLSRPVFMALMAQCDVVLNLTRHPDTLLWSIREALAVGKPFVASGSEVNRHYFGDYGLFTDNSPEDLARQIERAVNQGADLAAKAPLYIAQDKVRWRADMERIESLIGGA